MSDFFNNEIVQWILALLIVCNILVIFGWFKFKRDQQKVAEILKKSGIETRHTFRKTQATSSVTNLSKERIKKVRSKSSRKK